jgi:hypothetical protein
MRRRLTIVLPELLDAKGLAVELGIKRAAADAIMRQLPIVQVPGLRKVYVRRTDVAALLRRARSRRTRFLRDGTVRSEILCVSMPDTRRNGERGIVSARLRENRARRGLLEEKTDEIRAELRDLLVRGSNAALDVAEMARLAGISRETAHRYLREAGQLSWRKRNATRKEENDG